MKNLFTIALAAALMLSLTAFAQDAAKTDKKADAKMAKTEKAEAKAEKKEAKAKAKAEKKEAKAKKSKKEAKKDAMAK